MAVSRPSIPHRTGSQPGGAAVVDLPQSSAGGYVVAVDIGGTRVRMMLSDQDGTAVAHWNTHIADSAKTPGDIVNLVATGLDAMQATVPAAPLLHMTAGAPGITDSSLGVVLSAPNLPGWTSVPLAALLESRFGVAAAVDNDTNLAALGEFAAGAGQGMDSLLFVALGTGVGAGLVIDGKLHRGRHGSAGEIGYLPVFGMARQPLRMSETGQLEGELGGLGIEAHWKQMLGDAGGKGLDTLRAPQIFDLAEQGDALATELLHWAARLLADALCTAVLLLDPAMIVLGGGVGSHGTLCEAVTAILRKNDFALPAIRSSALGTGAQLYGAAAVSLAALAAADRC